MVIICFQLNFFFNKIVVKIILFIFDKLLVIFKDAAFYWETYGFYKLDENIILEIGT